MATSSQFTPVLKSELNFFAKKHVQCAQTGYETIPLKPINSVAPNSKRLEFFHNGKSTDFYRNLSKTYLYMKFKVTKRDGTPLATTASVCPINYIGQTVISSVEVSLNGTVVSRNSENHAYRAIMEALLSSDAVDAECHLASAGFVLDDGADVDKFVSSGNAGGKSRSEWLGNPVEVISRLHGDIFDSHLYLPNGLDLSVNINLNPDNFILWAAGTGTNSTGNEDCIFSLLDATLYVEICHINPAILSAQARVFQDSNAIIPVQHVECHAFTVANQQRYVSLDNVFSGRLPSVLVIGFVANAAYAGDQLRNPFNFQHFGLENLHVYVNGIQHTVGPVDFEKGSYVRGYFSLLKSSGLLSQAESPLITYKRYPSGYSLFAFDIGAEGSGGGQGTHSSLQPVGNVRIEAQFKNSLPEPITVIVYAIREGGVVEIDKHRSVYVSL